MSVMTRFVRRTLAGNRVRTAVSTVGIALSCALLVAVFASVSTLQGYLLERTIDTEGSWQVKSAGATQAEIDAAASDARTTAWTTIDEVGSAAFSESDAAYLGDFLNVATLPSDASAGLVVLGRGMDEGRLPDAPGEVSLPTHLAGRADLGTGADAASSGVRLAADNDDDGALSVGDVIELDLVKRLWTDPTTGETEVVTYQNTRIDKDYLEESGRPDAEEERSEPLQTVELTVVGFHYPDYAEGGQGALVTNGWLPALSTNVYLSTSVSSYDEVKAFAAELFSDDGYTLHDSLLRYQGMTDDRAIWDTILNFGIILAVVIVVASVSLIYNAFAISVAERTRQFGLLASLGASRRQLRRSVLVEAGMLAVVGVPVGVVLGIAGAAAVFAITGEGWASMVGVENASELPSVSVDLGLVALSVALSLVTIFVSAWVPALRAGRVSPTDAIRQTRDVRLARRARRSVEGSARDMRATAATGPKMRTALFGTPGFIAKRNLSRNGSKGRVAVASLAVSVLLLVTAGSISMLMNELVGMANETSGVDVQVTLQPDYELYGEEGLDPSRADLARDVAAATESASDSLAAEPSVDGCAYYVSTGIFANMPASMLDADQVGKIMSNEYDSNAFTTVREDGSMRVLMNVQFIDDGLWGAVIEEQGLDAETFCDPDRPVALAVNLVEGSLDGRYAAYAPFSATGDIELLRIAERNGAEFSGLGVLDDGSPGVDYSAPGSEAEAIGPQAFDTGESEPNLVPLDDALEDAGRLSIGALLSEPPDLFLSSAFPCVYLPMSAFETYVGLSALSPSATIGLVAQDSAAACDAAHDSFAEDDLMSAYIINLDENQRQANLMNWTIQVFLWCFTVICALIAVANVFNTVSTSFILRRREFAMLLSVGMGRRAFRRMIVRECASYAARGLVIGLALATVVAFLMYLALGLSVADATFTMPWPYVAGACGTVLVVLLASVAYALRKARASNVVEALREDAA